jgi:hypothetical protein
MFRHYAEWRILLITMLNAIMLSVIMLSVIMLSVIMLSVIMLSVIMLSVYILSVVAPFTQQTSFWINQVPFSATRWHHGTQVLY